MRRRTEVGSRCDDCGFRPGDVAPADAAVAARSFARRWRELFAAVTEHEERGSALLVESAVGDVSPVDRAARVVGAFGQAADDLERIWGQMSPALASTERNLAGGPSAIVAELGRASERLARAVERFESDQWGRTGLRDGQPVTALDVLRDAVHVGSHELRACRRALAEACEQPLDESEVDQWAS